MQALPGASLHPQAGLLVPRRPLLSSGPRPHAGRHLLWAEAARLTFGSTRRCLQVGVPVSRFPQLEGILGRPTDRPVRGPTPCFQSDGPKCQAACQPLHHRNLWGFVRRKASAASSHGDIAAWREPNYCASFLINAITKGIY